MSKSRRLDRETKIAVADQEARRTSSPAVDAGASQVAQTPKQEPVKKALPSPNPQGEGLAGHPVLEKLRTKLETGPRNASVQTLSALAKDLAKEDEPPPNQEADLREARGALEAIVSVVVSYPRLSDLERVRKQKKFNAANTALQGVLKHEDLVLRREAWLMLLRHELQEHCESDADVQRLLGRMTRAGHLIQLPPFSPRQVGDRDTRARDIWLGPVLYVFPAESGLLEKDVKDLQELFSNTLAGILQKDRDAWGPEWESVVAETRSTITVTDLFQADGPDGVRGPFAIACPTEISYPSRQDPSSGEWKRGRKQLEGGLLTGSVQEVQFTRKGEPCSEVRIFITGVVNDPGTLERTTQGWFERAVGDKVTEKDPVFITPALLRHNGRPFAIPVKNGKDPAEIAWASRKTEARRQIWEHLRRAFWLENPDKDPRDEAHRPTEVWLGSRKVDFKKSSAKGHKRTPTTPVVSSNEGASEVPQPKASGAPAAVKG